MKNYIRRSFVIFFLISISIYFSNISFAQNSSNKAQRVQIISDQAGMKLTVNGEDFMINGMNWDYFPIGTNYTYSLWDQPDSIIREALYAEMSLLKVMGVNAIRQYTGIPAKWIQYIYENYGIYTMLNHSFGRYGLAINDVWIANTEYGDNATRELLLQEVTAMVEEYKDTPGLLMFLLGNENNYGLFWEGAETEDIPIIDENAAFRARHMYKLFNEAAIAMKSVDNTHPVAICNGDVLFIDIIKDECRDVDIFGVNMYRGESFGDAFEHVKTVLNKPIMFTEFGADAFNAIENSEDQKSQTWYLINNWKEIYENAYGLGKAGNSIGGFTFQFSDGWWKHGQTTDLDIHNTEASWANGGYVNDFKKGSNNMNEEWFGICAKGPTNKKGLYTLQPRAAYFSLKKVHQFNPMKKNTTIQSINTYFSEIQ